MGAAAVSECLRQKGRGVGGMGSCGREGSRCECGGWPGSERGLVGMEEGGGCFCVDAESRGKERDLKGGRCGSCRVSGRAEKGAEGVA